jgi:hypothetical protein
MEGDSLIYPLMRDQRLIVLKERIDIFDWTSSDDFRDWCILASPFSIPLIRIENEFRVIFMRDISFVCPLKIGG